MLLKLHIAHDFGSHRSGGMRQNGTAKTGMNFFSDRGAADLRATLDHERFITRLGQIERGDQTVVAAANNDDIAPLRGGSVRHVQAAPSFRISSAASRPGAPMMPPPGCAAEPQM